MICNGTQEKKDAISLRFKMRNSRSTWRLCPSFVTAVCLFCCQISMFSPKVEPNMQTELSWLTKPSRQTKGVNVDNPHDRLQHPVEPSRNLGSKKNQSPSKVLWILLQHFEDALKRSDDSKMENSLVGSVGGSCRWLTSKWNERGAIFHCEEEKNQKVSLQVKLSFSYSDDRDLHK